MCRTLTDRHTDSAAAKIPHATGRALVSRVGLGCVGGLAVRNGRDGGGAPEWTAAGGRCSAWAGRDVGGGSVEGGGRNWMGGCMLRVNVHPGGPSSAAIHAEVNL